MNQKPKTILIIVILLVSVIGGIFVAFTILSSTTVHCKLDKSGHQSFVLPKTALGTTLCGQHCVSFDLMS